MSTHEGTAQDRGFRVTQLTPTARWLAAMPDVVRQARIRGASDAEIAEMYGLTLAQVRAIRP